MKEIDNNLKERGLNAQNKTIEGIFEFAKCMIELKDSCRIEQGGSSFSKVSMEWWGISQSMSSKWLAIGTKFKDIPRGISLPSAPSVLYQLTTLKKEEYDNAISDGIINQDLTNGIIIQ